MEINDINSYILFIILANRLIKLIINVNIGTNVKFVPTFLKYNILIPRRKVILVIITNKNLKEKEKFCICTYKNNKLRYIFNGNIK